MRKDEIIPCEKTKSCNAMRKDDKIKVSNGLFSPGVFFFFSPEISSFLMAGFVFSPFRMALFFLLSLRTVSYRFLSLRKAEMAQTNHHS